MIIRPVLLGVPQSAGVRTPQSVKIQRACSRVALRRCAELSAGPRGNWLKDSEGAPLPNEGFHWSVSHKRRWVAAVISDRPVGIDVELITPRREGLHDALAGAEDWEALGDRSWHSFFRLWTAKEATLKANQVGIAGLSACCLTATPEDRRMVLEFRGRAWPIEHYYHDNHVVAVTSDAEEVVWCIVEDAADLLGEDEYRELISETED